LIGKNDFLTKWFFNSLFGIIKYGRKIIFNLMKENNFHFEKKNVDFLLLFWWCDPLKFRNKIQPQWFWSKAYDPMRKIKIHSNLHFQFNINSYGQYLSMIQQFSQRFSPIIQLIFFSKQFLQFKSKLDYQIKNIKNKFKFRL